MTFNRLNELIPTFKTNEEARVDVNDWAVNTIREWGRTEFSSRMWVARTESMLREEFARIEAGRLDLLGYLRCSRAGSEFRLTREIRRAVFALKATREAKEAA